jgi:hypothetical protein
LLSPQLNPGLAPYSLCHEPVALRAWRSERDPRAEIIKASQGGFGTRVVLRLRHLAFFLH